MSKNIPVQVVAEFDGRGNVIPLSVAEHGGPAQSVEEVVGSVYAVGDMGMGVGLRYEVIVGGVTQYLFFDYRQRCWKLYIA